MNERRAVPRLRSFLQGRLYYNNRRSSVDCVIRDLTEFGARVVFSEAIITPDAVELYIPNKDECFRVHVVWRRGEDMGVAFIPAEAMRPHGAGDNGELGARMQQIETEIAQLRRIVNELRADYRQRTGGDG